MINSTPEWITRSVSRLRTAAPAADKAGDKLAKAALDKTCLLYTSDAADE